MNTVNNIYVKEIWQKDPTHLAITWNDDTTNDYNVYLLRKFCPCAVCVDEYTRERKFQEIPLSVHPISIENIGQYALSVRFSDGHSTGIYTYRLLKESPRLFLDS